jgi:hypothetical protein
MKGKLTARGYGVGAVVQVTAEVTAWGIVNTYAFLGTTDPRTYVLNWVKQRYGQLNPAPEDETTWDVELNRPAVCRTRRTPLLIGEPCNDAGNVSDRQHESRHACLCHRSRFSRPTLHSLVGGFTCSMNSQWSRDPDSFPSCAYRVEGQGATTRGLSVERVHLPQIRTHALSVELAEGRVTDVNCNRDGFENWRPVRSANVNPAGRWHHDPVELTIIRGIVHRRSATQDLD